MDSQFGRVVLVLCLMGASVLAQSVHRVKEGESLWLIAKQAGVSVDAIRVANGLTSDVIWEGSNLIIPTPVSPRSEPVILPELPEKKDELAVSLSEERASRFVVPPSSKKKDALSEKGWEILRMQVILDRAGFSPGKIDGYDGKYTRLARTLCEAWNPAALQVNIKSTRKVVILNDWREYVDTSLPGSGSLPDFKLLTKNPKIIHYYSALEYFAERFHCSESLLKKLNPRTDFQETRVGSSLVVPNVIPFEVERYFDRKGKGVWTSSLGKSEVERTVYISASDKMLTVWEGAQLIRSYPITLNEEDSPRGRRELGTITPGPHYSRKKTALNLLPGPNSPVGIVWCPLGNGFGIHGTCNPDSIGRATSSGCVRLANWDVVRFAQLVSKGTLILISEKDRSYSPN